MQQPSPVKFVIQLTLSLLICPVISFDKISNTIQTPRCLIEVFSTCLQGPCSLIPQSSYSGCSLSLQLTRTSPVCCGLHPLLRSGEISRYTGALLQSALVSMGLPVLRSLICTKEGKEQRSWGNRSSTLIRAGVLWKMFPSLRGSKYRETLLLQKKRRKLLLESVQRFKSFSSVGEAASVTTCPKPHNTDI